MGSCRHCVGFARFLPLSGMYQSRPLDIDARAQPISCSDARSDSRASLDARLRSRLHIALPHGPMRGRADPGGMAEAPQYPARRLRSVADCKISGFAQASNRCENAIRSRMLHDYVELFVEPPRQDQDCPFLVARKREPSGLTKAYINHCKIMSAEQSEPQQLRDQNLCRKTVPTLDPYALRGKFKITVEQN